MHLCNMVEQKHGQHNLIDVKELTHPSAMSEVEAQDLNVNESLSKQFLVLLYVLQENTYNLPPHHP